MYQLIYTSKSSVPLSGAELSRMLLKSRVNNDLADISGLLLCRHGSFLQLLEGDEKAVEAVFSRIADDPRHTGLQVILRAHAEQRCFPDWSMGFVHFEHRYSPEPSGLQEFFENKGRPRPGIGQSALKMLRNFRYGAWRRLVDRGCAPVAVRF